MTPSGIDVLPIRRRARRPPSQSSRHNRRSASKVWRKQPGCSMNGASVSKVSSMTCAWRLTSYPRTESLQPSRSFPLCRAFLLLPWRLPSAHLLDPHQFAPWALHRQELLGGWIWVRHHPHPSPGQGYAPTAFSCFSSDVG